MESADNNTEAPARKKRAPRATIGAAAAKLVEALRRGRYTEGFRAAEVLARALERDGDANAALIIRAALEGGGSPERMVSIGANKAGEWHEPAAATLDRLVLDAPENAQFERLVTELEAAPRFIAAGIDAPTRIFFEGPSGTGKTLAAQHLGARLGVPLLIGRLDHLVDSHLGDSAKRLAEMFTAARTTPCIVFIDEIDGIAGPRGSNASAADKETGRTTSSLLQQLDLMPPEQIVIVASNFPGEIDGALYRRFPTRIKFAYPGAEARKAMLRYWWRNVPMGETRVVDLAERTFADVSGSDLRALAMQQAREFILAQTEI